MSDILALLMLLGVIVALALVMPLFIMNRTIPRVIEIMRAHNAVDREHAVAAEDMGLTPKPYMQRILSARDHKPRALQLMLQLEIVKLDSEGRMYLCEEELKKTKWAHL